MSSSKHLIKSVGWESLSREQFLKDYWQQKPLVIKGFLADFIDPLSPEELAGLSLEQEVESRLVTRFDDWQVTDGPFEESQFTELPDKDWTLLVQNTEVWLPELTQLIRPFRFIPDWRLDDLMVSFAATGGGVGPHIDQYDVFLLQGSGSRHWQVGEPANHYQTIVQPGGLKQVAPFEAIIDEVLEAGDLLYIPPNTPHNGTASSPCLTYSIGFRAPSHHQLLEQLFMQLTAQDESQSVRFRDQQIHNVSDEATAEQVIPGSVIPWCRQALQDVSDEQLLVAFGCLTTELKRPILEPLEQPVELIEQTLKARSVVLTLDPISRMAHSQIENKLFWFVNGQAFLLPPSCLPFLQVIEESGKFDTKATENGIRDIEFIRTLAILIQQGCLIIEQP